MTTAVKDGPAQAPQDQQAVLTERRGHVLLVTLNRPAARNAVNLAAAGGVFRLPAQIPKKVAMEMILTGEPTTARRALELGLVNRVVPQDEVVAAALELAGQIIANAPLSVQASKRIANGIIDGQVAAEAASWELSRAEGRALGGRWTRRKAPGRSRRSARRTGRHGERDRVSDFADAPTSVKRYNKTVNFYDLYHRELRPSAAKTTRNDGHDVQVNAGAGAEGR